MWQEQTAGGSANLLERPPQATLDNFQLAVDLGPHSLVLFTGARKCGQVVKPQQRQADLLRRTIVQLGTEPAQESLVERGSTSCRSPHPLVELLVLLDHLSEPNDLIAEFPLLLADGVANTLDESGEEEIDDQRDSSHYQPAPALCRGNIAGEVIGRVVELGGREHLARAAAADRAVNLDQLITRDVRRKLGCTLRLPNIGGNFPCERARKFVLDRKLLTDQTRDRAVDNAPGGIPNLEDDDFLTKWGIGEQPVKAI